MKTLSQLLLAIIGVLQSCIMPSVETITERMIKKTVEQKQTLRTQSVVFITGFDEGENSYYRNAKEYFLALGMQVVMGQESLEEIMVWLAANHKYQQYQAIHIVSHSNPWSGISLKAKKQGARITLATLEDLKETVSLPMLDGFVNFHTKIVFHACGLGQNTELLQALQTVFTAEEVPQIFASNYFTVFGGKYAGHYLAKPHFGYYPTAESPGPLALANQMRQRYPNTKINWLAALKIRSETQPGSVFTYKFNIPVSWDFELDDNEVLPDFDNKEALMDWIIQDEAIATELFSLGIPVEKYRWRSKLQGNKLLVEGKTTVICVLQPVMDREEPTEYKKLTLEDTSLYHRL